METTEYYSVDKIKDRLKDSLGSDEWKSLFKTDVGQSLLSFGANIIHYSFLGFQNTVNQMYLETSDSISFTEAIAKNYNIVPEPYTPATLSIEIVPVESIILDPYELRVDMDNGSYYNINSIDLKAGSPSVIKVYEGQFRRRASKTYKAQSKSWVFESLPALQERRIKSKKSGNYYVLENNIYLPSIYFYSTRAENGVRIEYSRTENFYTESKESRVYSVERDYLHNYNLVLGDDIYGKAYTNEEIYHLSYLQTSGKINFIEDYSKYKVLVKDIDVSKTYQVLNISKMINGTSESDIDELKKTIKNRISGGKRVVTVDDHLSYLNSRADIATSNVYAERDVDLLDIKNCNVVTLYLKPALPGSYIDSTDILTYLRTYGPTSTVYNLGDVEYFNIDLVLGITFDFGSNKSYLATLIKNIVEDRYSWNNTGLGEVLLDKYIVSVIAKQNVPSVDYTDIRVKFNVKRVIKGVSEFSFSKGDILVPEYSCDIDGINITLLFDEYLDKQLYYEGGCYYIGELEKKIKIAVWNETAKGLEFLVSLASCKVSYTLNTKDFILNRNQALVVDSVKVNENDK